MSTELFKQYKDFKKKAKAQPTVTKEAKKKTTTTAAVKYMDALPSTSSGGHYRYSVLSRILRHLRTRFQRGDMDPIELDQILEETDQLDCLRSTKTWLTKVALCEHPKVETLDNGRCYRFKPTYKLKDGKSLMRLLKQNDLKGLGGVLYDDIKESLPNCDKIMNKYNQEIITITRSHDKKKVLFFNDRSANLTVDEEFQKLWRSFNVDATNETKIEEYLNKEGNGALQSGKVLKKPVAQRRKRQQKKRVSKKSKDNEHMGDILIDFSDDHNELMC